MVKLVCNLIINAFILLIVGHVKIYKLIIVSVIIKPMVLGIVAIITLTMHTVVHTDIIRATIVFSTQMLCHCPSVMFSWACECFKSY